MNDFGKVVGFVIILDPDGKRNRIECSTQEEMAEKSRTLYQDEGMEFLTLVKSSRTNKIEDDLGWASDTKIGERWERLTCKVCGKTSWFRLSGAPRRSPYFTCGNCNHD